MLPHSSSVVGSFAFNKNDDLALRQHRWTNAFSMHFIRIELAVY